MRTARIRNRVAAGAIAAATALSLTAFPAAAEEGSGPYVFDSGGAGQAVSIVVGLPAAVADGLAPVLANLPGIELQGSDLVINLANVLGELELPLVDDAPGTVAAAADALSLTGSLSGLVDTLLGGTASCLDSPLDISIPPDAATPLVSLTLLDAECTTDTNGRLSVASSRVADLEVNLAGAIELLGPAAAPVTDAVETITDTVQDTVLGPLVDSVLTPVQDAVNDTLGLNLDLSEAVRVPELLDLPLVSIDLIESTTRSITEGDSVRNVSTSTLAGVSLLGTICVPDTTYRAETFATGLPGGNDFLTSIPPIDLSICDTATLSPILRLQDVDGVVGDVLVNLGGGELQPLSELLAPLGLPTDELFSQLDGLLGTLGVSSVIQGSQGEAVRSEDGRRASVAVNPFRITVAPLAEALAATPLSGLKVELRGLAVTSNAGAAPAPPEDPPPAPAPPPAAPPAPGPDPAPETPVSMPRTGGGALAGLAGVLAIAGALTLRRRGTI